MTRAAAIDAVTTKSGTKIEYEVAGSGPPLVLVHGSINDASSWQPVRSMLEQGHTVYAVNRRGHGGSSPAAPHDIEDQFEDIAAVVDSVGEPVHLFGHSFGAVCSLGAAFLTKNIRSLMLYEPPPPGRERQSELHAELPSLRAGPPDELVARFLQLGPGVPPEGVEAMRKSPAWPTFAQHAPALAEEIAAMGRYQFDPSTLGGLDLPVLLLLGDRSPDTMRIVIDMVREHVPQAKLEVLEGQGHAAHFGAPDLVAEKIKQFMESVE